MATLALSAIGASDPATRHADWLELTALAAADRSRSLQDLIQVIRRSGTSDTVTDGGEPVEAFDRGSEISESVAEAAFAELEARQTNCGGVYPFKLNQQTVRAMRTTDRSIYLFLFLIAIFGAKAGPPGIDTLALFDELAAAAAASYLTGESYIFGFPRRVAPAGFVAAVADLVSQMREGQGNRRRPTTRFQKDAKLDIVSWRSFADGRPGKLIAFGQCATGDNWRDKLAELVPRTFYSLWLAENPVIDPVRMFFMPFRVPDDEWPEVAYPGGVVFDRCRLAHHAEGVPRAIRQRVALWNASVLSNKVRGR